MPPVRSGLLVLAFLGSIVLLGGCEPVPPRPTEPPEPSAVELKVVKLPELNKVIAANPGKVVLVDIWGEF
jgi:hypothetical protein